MNKCSIFQIAQYISIFTINAQLIVRRSIFTLDRILLQLQGSILDAFFYRVQSFWNSRCCSRSIILRCHRIVKAFDGQIDRIGRNIIRGDLHIQFRRRDDLRIRKRFTFQVILIQVRCFIVEIYIAFSFVEFCLRTNFLEFYCFAAYFSADASGLS